MQCCVIRRFHTAIYVEEKVNPRRNHGPELYGFARGGAGGEQNVQETGKLHLWL